MNETKLSFDALTLLMTLAKEELTVAELDYLSRVHDCASELVDGGWITIGEGEYIITDSGKELAAGIKMEQAKGIETLAAGTPWQPGITKLFAFAPEGPEGVNDGSCVIMNHDRKICMICYFSEETAMTICNVLNNCDHVVPKKTYAMLYDISLHKDKQIRMLMNHIVKTNKALPAGHPLQMESVKLMQSMTVMNQADNSLSPITTHKR